MTSILRMTQEEREAIMEANPPEICGLHGADVYFDWSWEGCGFGQLSFSYNAETGEITAMNEFMSRESVRKFLHSLADYIADRVVLSNNPEDIPPIDSKAEFEREMREAQEYINEWQAKRKRSSISASEESGDSTPDSDA